MLILVLLSGVFSVSPSDNQSSGRVLLCPISASDIPSSMTLLSLALTARIREQGPKVIECCTEGQTDKNRNYYLCSYGLCFSTVALLLFLWTRMSIEMSKYVRHNTITKI